jgi:hypothetical protein
MPTSAALALAPVVDALVDEPVAGLWPDQVQALIAEVAPQIDRLQGCLTRLLGALPASLPTDDGGMRSTAGWLADTTRESPQSAGRDLRVAQALRELPMVVEAVLDGRLTQPQAAALSRLVGRIPAPDLAEAGPALVQVGRAPQPGRARPVRPPPARDALRAGAGGGRGSRTSGSLPAAPPGR